MHKISIILFYLVAPLFLFGCLAAHNEDFEFGLDQNFREPEFNASASALHFGFRDKNTNEYTYVEKRLCDVIDFINGENSALADGIFPKITEAYVVHCDDPFKRDRLNKIIRAFYGAKIAYTINLYYDFSAGKLVLKSEICRIYEPSSEDSCIQIKYSRGGKCECKLHNRGSWENVSESFARSKISQWRIK